MKSRSLVRMLWPLALGVGAALLFSHLTGPSSGDLLLHFPSESGARACDVRVVRDDGAQALRTRRAREPGARSLVVPVRLSRGHYVVEVYADGADPMVGSVEFTGDDAVDVELGVRR